MSVTIVCPNLVCRGIMSVPDEVRGRKIRCGACGKVFVVPPSGEGAPVTAEGRTDGTMPMPPKG